MKLQENEKIIKVIKNHFFTNILLGFFTLIFLAFLWVMYYVFSDFQYIFLVFILFVQIFLVFFYYTFLYFEFWVIIITNQRIISVKKLNIFQNTYIDMNLWEIHDIKAKQKWICSHYFWFGKLKFEFKNWEKISLKYVKNVLEETKEIIQIINTYK